MYHLATDRPQPYHLSRPCRDWRVPHLPRREFREALTPVGHVTDVPHTQNYTPPNATASEYQSIPLNKIEDFGVHANSYYPLEISHFKSTNDAKLLDLLWNKYWVTTLSQSPLVSVSLSLCAFAGLAHHLPRPSKQNRAYMTSQIGDLVEKIGKTEQSVQHRCGIGAMAPIIAAARAAKNKQASDDKEVKNEETPLSKAVKDR